jgi:hypothetical protein
MTHGLHMKHCLLAGGILLFATLCASAQGGGSIGLVDVLEVVQSDAKLTAEIQDELKKNSLKVEDVVCTGFRHGSRWTELSVSRAAPYECDIGKRTLIIQADRIYYDAKKKPLGDMKKANPKRADSFKEANFRWAWKPLAGNH